MSWKTDLRRRLAWSEGRPGRPVAWIAAGVVVVVALGWFAVTGLHSMLTPSTPGPEVAVPAAPGACTLNGTVDTPPRGGAGDVVCLTGDTKSRLSITRGGSPGSPVTYTGGGTAAVRGIDVKADNVVVEGFVSAEAESTGATLQGSNIVFQNNTVTHPVNDGDDTDGIRFWGDGIKILNNKISDISDGSDCDRDGCGDGPHPDCMQTWYSESYPTSSNIVIDGNRCEQAAAQCLIAEGPVIPDEGINGPGESGNWVFNNNYCDTGAAQAVMLRDIKNAQITNNDFEGKNNKAIALSDASTGAHVSGNTLNPRIHKLITFDDNTVSEGYVGPAPDRSE
jgi:parallel beta helix pectate lyase-like protein